MEDNAPGAMGSSGVQKAQDMFWMSKKQETHFLYHFRYFRFYMRKV